MKTIKTKIEIEISDHPTECGDCENKEEANNREQCAYGIAKFNNSTRTISKSAECMEARKAAKEEESFHENSQARDWHSIELAEGIEQENG